LTGPGAEGLLYGAHTPHENELCDTAIRISHLAPHTHSNQLFRSIAFKGGRRVFLGRIHVAREGQKTNAYQSHKAILWENGAEVYSRPQLEIFADDVRCTHGVTTGFLQGEMLFYLRSRGIPDAAARALIAEGFLMEALESVPTEALRTYARHNLGLPL
jgi:Fe-S cluster assembly protein SufD